MRMNLAAWNMVHNFKMTEFNEPMQMDQDLIFKLDTMRTWVGKPFIVLASYATDGHSTDSMHYHGRAVDGYFKGLTAIEQYMVAEQFNWGGLGFYPYWENKITREKLPGIHVDTRLMAPGEKAIRWWRDKGEIYQPVNLVTISSIVKAA